MTGGFISIVFSVSLSNVFAESSIGISNFSISKDARNIYLERGLMEHEINNIEKEEKQQYLNFKSENTDDPESDYELKIDYNAYKTSLYIEEKLNTDISEGMDYSTIDYLINNYDDFRTYMLYLDDKDFCDLMYSITTTINDLDENVENPWKEILLSKSNEYNKYFLTKEEKKIQLRAISSYNPSGAVNYAKKYLRSTGPNYYNFHGDGGDCANFISQCLYEGGGLPKRKYDNDKWNNSNWYYDDKGQNFPKSYSASWAQASNFKHHWAARAGISVHDVPKNASSIYFKTAYGTPISIIKKSTGQARHTIIVGGKRGSNDWWYYDHSGGNFDNSLLNRVRGEKIVQECITF